MRMSFRNTLIAYSDGRYLTFCVLIAGFALSACSVMSWQSPYGQSHALTGRIWDVSAAGLIDRPTLLARLARADFVLLGEKHDNPDHHRLQAEAVRGLVALGRRPAVGFEMFTVADADAIAKHLALAPNDAAGLGPAVNWHTSGWPDWAMYQPIAEAVLAAKLPILATNLPLSSARTMSRGGLPLEPSVRRDLGLDRPLSEAMFARMSADIRKSHCGYGSAASIHAMLEVQRARDAQMARSLIAGATAAGAILIAGAGHVRSDYGIPAYLTAKAPGKRVISIAFVEVDDQQGQPKKYLLADAEMGAPFDYLWFTPRIDDEDACEKFKSQLERFKNAR